MTATDKRVEFKVRPGTQDALVFREVVAENQYRLPDQLDGVVFDVGANIGAFALACHCRGAEEVWCFEPDLENFNALVWNTAAWKETTGYFRKAMWRSDRHERPTFSGYPANSTACGTMIPNAQVGGVQGHVPVECTSLDRMLFGASVPIRLLKIDAEGSEYPILYTSRMLDRVEEIIGECHDLVLAGLAGQVPIEGFGPADFTMAGMKRFLESQGFKVEWVPEAANNKINSLFWAKRK